MGKKMTKAQIKQFQSVLMNNEQSTATIQKYLRDVKAFWTLA